MDSVTPKSIYKPGEKIPKAGIHRAVHIGPNEKAKLLAPPNAQPSNQDFVECSRQPGSETFVR
jgi:hypothetical protein